MRETAKPFAQLLSDIVHNFRNRLAASPLARRILSGAGWSLAGAVGGRMFAVVSSIVVARVLGKEGFGQFGMIQSTIVSFAVFAGLGLGLTATKQTAEFRYTDPLRAGRVIKLSQRVAFLTGTVTSLGVFFGADYLATHAMAAPELAPLIRITCVILLLGALNGVQDGTLSGLEAFSTIARLSLIGGFVTFLFTITGVMSAGLPGACLAIVGGTVVTWVLKKITLRSALKKYSIPRDPQNCLQEKSAIWRFSIPAVLSSISVVPVNWACNLILVNQPNGYSEMGLLNAAVQWRNIILFIPSILISVSLPMMTSLGATGELRKQRKVFLANIGLSAVVAITVALAASAFSSQIMSSYGSSFSEGRTVLILQAFAAAIAAVVGIVGQYLISRDEMWVLIGLQLLWAIMNVGLSWTFREHGAQGISLAYVLAYILHFGTTCSYTFYSMKRNGGASR
jgi:O-antigen/teichoic acid export membrane protein